MKKLWKVLLLSSLSCLLLGMSVLAEEEVDPVSAIFEDDANTDDISDVQEVAPISADLDTNVDSTKPFLALGADLSSEQRATVLELMGLSAADLENYNVIYITNDQEHAYLDAYISPSVIGSKSLSSVMVTQKEKGHGVIVSTKNISYCTTGMYRNALLTAGVEDAEVLVVGPTNISGTAGLIGALKAYESLTGEEVSDTVLDTALNELVATGEIVTGGENSEDIEALIAFVKAQLANGDLDSEEDIRDAIEEGEEKFGVSLSEDEINQIIQVMNKIKKLGLDPNKLLDQASDLYDKFGDDFLQHLNDGGFFNSVGNFFKSIGNAVSNFFSKLFG